MSIINKKSYGKTTRLSKGDNKIIITEKLDGSNLGFLLNDGNLLICQRSQIFGLEDIEEMRKIGLYKGLGEWLKINGDDLTKNLKEGSGIFGEWIGMGAIKEYDLENGFDKKFYAFAKCNFNKENLDLESINYNPKLLPVVFNEVPKNIGFVPIVTEIDEVDFSKEKLDEIYEEYINKVDRHVEGFIAIEDDFNIKKYVRFKNGKLNDHYDTNKQPEKVKKMDKNEKRSIEELKEIENEICKNYKIKEFEIFNKRINYTCLKNNEIFKIVIDIHVGKKIMLLKNIGNKTQAIGYENIKTLIEDNKNAEKKKINRSSPTL
ncbi:MAG: RNA ligase family protein [Mycoplasma sp.]